MKRTVYPFANKNVANNYVTNKNVANTSIAKQYIPVTRASHFLPILIIVLASIHLHRAPVEVAELEIVPDSVEYAVGAHRFATTGRYEIQVNGQALPPRYPPGFSVLFLAPVYAVAPGQIGNGIFVVWLAGVLAALFAYLIGEKLAGPWGGVFAAIALLLHPQFAGYTQVIMTDVPAVALGLMACWIYLTVRNDPQRKWFLLAGCVVALSVAIRPLMGLLAIPFVIELLWNRRPGWGRNLLALGVPILLVVVGTSYQQFRAFGDFRRTGYQYWLAVPYDYFSLTFSPRYLAHNLHLFSINMMSTPIMLGVIGALALLTQRNPHLRPIAIFLLVGILPISLIHLFYFYTNTRFHFPLLSLILIVAGSGIAALIPDVLRRGFRFLLPFLALTILFPTIREDPPEEARPIRYDVATAAADFLPDNATLISAIDPAYLEHMVARGTSRRILPIDRHVDYANALLTKVRIPHLNPPPTDAFDHACPGLVTGGARPLFMFTADEEITQLKKSVGSGALVYLELLSTPENHPSRMKLQANFEFVPMLNNLPWLVQLKMKQPPGATTAPARRLSTNVAARLRHEGAHPTGAVHERN